MPNPNTKNTVKVAAFDHLGRTAPGTKTIRCFPFERAFLAEHARATRAAHRRRPDWPRFTLLELRRTAAYRYA